MANGLSVDGDAWEDHARWWDAESRRAVEAMDVTPETLTAAQGAFGKLGASTVGAAYAEALQARREAGQRFGAYAQSVAEHIRRDVQGYRDVEADAATTLSS
ncbi:MAG: hypothetical protein QG597_2278 [Actinomycetota bacterium]|nr:hypothetical protein [Actinomycetota bacterium]